MEIWKKRLSLRISPTRTQEPADQLIDYRRMKAILGKIKRNPRVKVFTGGRSRENKDIDYIVITAPDNMKKLLYYKALAKQLSAPHVFHHTLNKMQVTEPDFVNLAKEAKATVFFFAGSWPFEAANTEAFIKLAKTLATSKKKEIVRILEEEIVVILPMMCPDGRELAINEWRKFPLSDGRAGIGNARGALLNRDFSCLAEPETMTVHQVFNDWSPFVAYEPHEDRKFLGAHPEWPQLCWCPPYRQPFHKDIDKRVIQIINELSAAIAERWKTEGFEYRSHPRGKSSMFNLLELGSQRSDVHFDLHGTPTLYTESARSPGTNSWEERIDQKISASLAILEEIAENPIRFMESKYVVSRENTLGERSAFIIPIGPKKQRDLLAVSVFIKNLLKCCIQVYYTRNPYEAYVIPTNQPQKSVVMDLLSARKWNPWTLSIAYGVTLYKLEYLSCGQAEKFANTKLHPVKRALVPRGSLVE